MQKNIAIIGAGAAGVFAAIRLGESSLFNIQVFEKGNELLRKVRISGGGRCNVTHRYSSHAQFSKNYPRGHKILKNNFDIFSPLDMQDWLVKRGVQLKTEADGRMFPTTDSSETIIQCFEKELKQFKIPILFHSDVTEIKQLTDGFELTINNKKQLFDYVLVATGGAQKERELDMYSALKIKTISPVPSLFTFKINEKPLTELMGLSISDTLVRIMGSEFNELGPVLITHWGLSGPAVLKLSAWGAFLLNQKNYQFQIAVNWAGKDNENKIITDIESIATEHSNGKVVNYKIEKFPNRFWEYLLSKSEIDLTKKWSELSKKNKNKLAQNITNSVYDINGKTTYKDEFVIAGGIDTEAINTRSMESIQYPNLYFIGEITNIDGITGGFNFQNCWTNAIVCAENIISKSNNMLV
jgi:predicted Rossmann fold flavoprotein